MSSRGAVVALTCLVVAMAAGEAWSATIQGPRRSALERLEEGDAIRKRLMLRGGRFEAQPVVGFTLNDAFRRNVLFGAHLAYHFNDDWAAGITAFGSAAFNSDLANRVETQRPEKVDSGSFSDLTYLVTAEALYSPLVGKFALFGRSVVNYDFHVLAGIGVSQVGGGSPNVDELSVAPVIGLGLRTFALDWLAVNIEVRDYIFSSALNSVVDNNSDSTEAKADSEFSNNFTVTVGVSFFLPTQPKVSD